MEDSIQSNDLPPPVMSRRQMKIISVVQKKKKKIMPTPTVLNERIMNHFPSGSSTRRIKRKKYEERKKKKSSGHGSDSDVENTPRKRQRTMENGTSPGKKPLPKVTPESRVAALKKATEDEGVGLCLDDSDLESVKSYSSIPALDRTFNEDGLRVAKTLKKRSKDVSKQLYTSNPDEIDASMAEENESFNIPWSLKQVIKTIPNNVKASRPLLRACLGCAMIKEIDQWYLQGCNNCEEFVEMKGCWQNVERCSSKVYSGLIALMNPMSSEIECINNIDIGYVVPGLYAASVSGTLPLDVIERMKAKGMRYRKKFNENDYPKFDMSISNCEAFNGSCMSMAREEASVLYKTTPETPKSTTPIPRKRRKRVSPRNCSMQNSSQCSVEVDGNVTVLDSIMNGMEQEYDEKLLSIYKNECESTPRKRTVNMSFADEPSILLLKPTVAEMYPH